MESGEQHITVNSWDESCAKNNSAQGGSSEGDMKSDSDTERMSQTLRKVQQGKYQHNIEEGRVTTAFSCCIFISLYLKKLY